MRNKFLIFSAFLILFSVNAFAQSGGYEITQSVLASGGGQNSTGGQFSLDGTIGQSLAGGALSGSPFTVTSGFWNFSPLAPTAAGVKISGRVFTTEGRGIRNVILILTASSGNIKTATTTAFGYFSFDDVLAGDTYIITAHGKRFTFNQPTQVLNINDDTYDVNFVGQPTSGLRDLR